MVPQCLSFLFWLGSLVLSDFYVPFSVDIGFATLSNLNCSTIEISATNGTFNSSQWSLTTTNPSLVACSLDIQLGILNTRVVGNTTVPPIDLFLRKSSDAECMCAEAVKERCEFSVGVTELRTDPPSPLVDDFLKGVRHFMETQANPYVCDAGLSYIKQEFSNHTVNPPLPYPSMYPGATPLEGTAFFRSLVNAVNKFPVIKGVNFAASVHNGTTIHLSLTSAHGTRFSTQSIITILKELSTYATPLFKKLLDGFSNSLIKVDIPRSFGASLDISFEDFKYDSTEGIFSVSKVNGITIYNLRAFNTGEWDRLVSYDVDPFVTAAFTSVVNYIANTTESTSSDEDEGRFVFFKHNQIVLQDTVPTGLWASFLVVGLVILGITIFFSVKRHRQNPVKDLNGEPLSMKRIIIEDTILILMAIVSTYLFAASSSVTAATLVVGEELDLLAFSLIGTVVNLYNAGLRLLSILVFIFSGVYPYLKILAIILWTLVLQNPTSSALVVVDYFGKFSFLDSFAMIVMTGGLQIRGIVNIKILSGFYLFLGATVLSILTGNFATALWRRNTSLRSCGNLNEPSDSSEEDDHSLSLIGGASIPCEKRVFFTPKRLFLAAANGIFVAVCVILPWVYPCIRYRVTGLAALLQPDDQEMTLYQLSSISWVLIITCQVTLVVTPILYALLYPYCSLFASWSAADALLLACVFGIFQLGEFVEFVIGSDKRAIYQAEAHLLWPLIPLFLASLWQWILVNYVFGQNNCAVRMWMKYKKYREPKA